jgi:hypothetical protein
MKKKSKRRANSFFSRQFCSAATVATVIDCLSIIPFSLLFSRSCHPWKLSHVVHVNSQSAAAATPQNKQTFSLSYNWSNNLFDNSPTPISRVNHVCTDEEHAILLII